MKDQPFESEEARKAFILETVEEISELLKTLQHPKRLEILSLMLKAEIEFRTLMEKTGLPKSALGNHLSELLEKNLIDKLDRGIYRITSDGREFLSSLSDSYLHSRIREHKRLELHRKRYQEIISRYTSYQSENEKLLVSESNKRSKNIMEVELKTRSAFTVMGMKARGNKPKDFIPDLFERFFKRHEEIKGKIRPKQFYGIAMKKIRVPKSSVI